MGDFATAEQTLVYAQGIIAGSGQRELGFVLAGLAELRYFQKRYDEAANLERGALAILEKHLSPDQLQLVRVKANYAKILRKSHRTEEARDVERELRSVQRNRANDPGERYTISAGDLRRK
jgi:hypothetical protein